VANNGGSSGPGLLATGCLVLIVLFVPLVGHIILTVMILGDDLSSSEKLLWLLLVWLVPIVGPLLYLVIGQRRNRLLSQL
jgi:Phospholipase_D-nuclease N-terminal